MLECSNYYIQELENLMNLLTSIFEIITINIGNR